MMKRKSDTSLPYSKFQIHSVACPSLRKRITILYNSKTGFSDDASELQILGILWLARREVEEKDNIKRSNLRLSSPHQHHHQWHSPLTPAGLSLKKSLQRFLQRRRDRIRAAAIN
ncbi:PREDICTED: protein TIFY 5A-like [Ipomoea nil]|uniref:protein TIFY 5A-like n=1 Tax=Ipomoea nil TaxID=35883 RepID=UPI00090084C0|nr:PREDICTED: protein TIFY 5A-like [Ipomoea nil]